MGTSKLLIPILVVALLGACTGFRREVGGPPAGPRVDSFTLKGPYLDVLLLTSSGTVGLFLRDEPVCRALVSSGEDLEFSRAGSLGRLSGPSGACDAMGSSTLTELRQRRPRGVDSNRARSNTVFSTMYTGEEVLMARGRFPPVSRLGFVSDDVVVVVDATPACRAVFAQGQAFMTYQANTEPVLYLTRGENRCNVFGLAKPIRD